jgi:SAM-dependent methyltransferase
MATNPWTNISFEDYEGHMQEVGQLQLLNSIFKHYLELYAPKRIAILGCTTGNGLENIKHGVESITAIDINSDYLDELKARFSDLKNLNVICGDIQDLELKDLRSDLIYAALIFEYVDLKKTLGNIKNWLAANGKLISVIQLPNEKLNAISSTQFQSLNQLGSIMHLVDVAYFKSELLSNGFKEEESEIIELSSGKRFYVGVHIK